MSKFNNKKVEVDGIIFDSIAEAKYYEQLKWLKVNKQIKDFIIQPRYLLQDKFKLNDVTRRKIEYIADFEVTNLDGTVYTVDIKGVETEAFKIKKKLFEYKYEQELVLLKYTKTYGFEKLEDAKKRGSTKCKNKKAKPSKKPGSIKTSRKSRSVKKK